MVVNGRAKELMYALELGERRGEDAPQTIHWVHRFWDWDYAVIRDHLEVLEVEQLISVEPEGLAGVSTNERWWVPDAVTLTAEGRYLLQTDSYVKALRRSAEC